MKDATALFRIKDATIRKYIELGCEVEPGVHAARLDKVVHDSDGEHPRSSIKLIVRVLVATLGLCSIFELGYGQSAPHKANWLRPATQQFQTAIEAGYSELPPTCCSLHLGIYKLVGESLADNDEPILMTHSQSRSAQSYAKARGATPSALSDVDRPDLASLKIVLQTPHECAVTTARIAYHDLRPKPETIEIAKQCSGKISVFVEHYWKSLEVKIPVALEVDGALMQAKLDYYDQSPRVLGVSEYPDQVSAGYRFLDYHTFEFAVSAIPSRIRMAWTDESGKRHFAPIDLTKINRIYADWSTGKSAI